MGVATDTARGLLFVADPGKSAVIAFRAWPSRSRLYMDGATTIAAAVNAHWVGVNSVGTVFFTDVGSETLFAISAKDVEDLLNGRPAGAPRALYAAAENTPLKNPQAVVGDGFNVLWVNGDAGATAGVVLKGVDDPPSVDKEATVLKLAANSPAAYGLCTTGTRMFFTDANAKVFSMRKDGGDLMLVTDMLHHPRGCAYDGDGTIFVADKQPGKVYSFSGGSPELGQRLVTLAFTLDDAYGLAVFARDSSSAGRAQLSAAAMLGVLAAFGSS